MAISSISSTPYLTHSSYLCLPLYLPVSRVRTMCVGMCVYIYICVMLFRIAKWLHSDPELDDFKWPSVSVLDRYFSSANLAKSTENGKQRVRRCIVPRGRKVWCSCGSSVSTRIWIFRKHRVTCTKVCCARLSLRGVV